jgi:hypothetical protein
MLALRTCTRQSGGDHDSVIPSLCGAYSDSRDAWCDLQPSAVLRICAACAMCRVDRETQCRCLRHGQAIRVHDGGRTHLDAMPLEPQELRTIAFQCTAHSATERPTNAKLLESLERPA